MLDDHDLDKALDQISPVEKQGVGARAIRTKYAEEPLSCKGSLKVGGRYNYKETLQKKMCLSIQGALYISNSIDLALEESRILSRTVASCFNITYKLKAVLDLTNKDNLVKLGTSLEELTEKNYWEDTQKLGLAVVRSGKFNAIKFPSAKVQTDDGYNIAIFINEAEKNTTISMEGIYLKAELVKLAISST